MITHDELTQMEKINRDNGCLPTDDGQQLIDEVRYLGQWINSLQSEGWTTCVYCGHRYGPSDSTPAWHAEKLKEHIQVCERHPMRSLKIENEKLRRQLTAEKIDDVIAAAVSVERRQLLAYLEARPEVDSSGSENIVDDYGRGYRCGVAGGLGLAIEYIRARHDIQIAQRTSGKA